MYCKICTEQDSFYNNYESSYDYTVYDTNFVFIDEEDEVDSLDDEIYYS